MVVLGGTIPIVHNTTVHNINKQMELEELFGT